MRSMPGRTMMRARTSVIARTPMMWPRTCVKTRMKRSAGTSVIDRSPMMWSWAYMKARMQRSARTSVIARPMGRWIIVTNIAYVWIGAGIVLLTELKAIAFASQTDSPACAGRRICQDQCGHSIKESCCKKKRAERTVSHD